MMRTTPFFYIYPHRTNTSRLYREAMKSLKMHAKYVLVVLTAAYITAFSVMQILTGNHLEVISRVDTAGLMANAAPIAAIDARVLQAARDGAVNVTVKAVQDEMLRQADTLEAVGRNLYLGDGELKPPGKHVKYRFEAKTFEVEEWIESEPARFVMETTSLWDALKLYYQNCRRVVHDVADDVDMRGTREWRYIIRNGIKRMSGATNDLLDQQTREADDHTVFVEKILIAILSILLLIFSVVLAHFWHLLRKVSEERLGLYTVFVGIPRPIVVKLATKKITTGGDSDSDSDDDDAPGNGGNVDHNNDIAAAPELLPSAPPPARLAPAPEAGTVPMVGILAKNGGAPWTLGRGGPPSAAAAGGRLPGRTSMDDFRSTPQSFVDSGPRRASVDSAYGNRGGFVAAAGGAGGGFPGYADAGAHRMQNMRSSSPLMMTALVPAEHPAEHTQVPPGISSRFRSAASSMMAFLRRTVQSKVAPEQRFQGAQQLGEPRTSSVNKFAKTGRELDPAGSQLNIFAVPILLWGVLVIFSFTLSFRQFQEIDAPMQSLGVAARVEVLASTARFYANDLVLAGTSGESRSNHVTSPSHACKRKSYPRIFDADRARLSKHEIETSTNHERPRFENTRYLVV